MTAVLFLAFAGGLAGLVAWMIMEPSAPAHFADPRWVQWSGMFTLLLGALVGASIGAAYGKMLGSRRHLLNGLGGGVVLGAIGGSLGYQIGGAIVKALMPMALQPSSPLPLNVLARTIAFAPLGALIGVVIGIPSRSKVRAVQGLIGGAIGGAIAGATFDIVSIVVSAPRLAMAAGEGTVEIGGPGRAVTSVIIGAAIGLCAAIFERLGRKAWIRLVLGRNEGKEWVVDTGQAYLGSSETAHVPLFGDPNVIPYHACVVRQGGGYSLVDGGSPAGTYVNGQRVAQVALAGGEQIQIGGFLLQFLLRSGTAPARAAEGRTAPIPMSQPVQLAAMAPTPIGPPTTSATISASGMTAATPSMGTPTLVALDGPLAGQRFPVFAMLEMGRESRAVPLGFDSMASRRHASFGPASGGLQVQDLGSTNGTFLNGQRVTTALARAGDVVRVGATSFRVE
ncbi:MAG: FHA domain-containing protein [Fimbriimonadaceae bacterium]|nr:FHA domain-containing protein [Fimbriimonadaceae bacterium]